MALCRALEVGSGVGASTWVMVLLEVRLEWRSSVVVRLVSKSSTSSGHQIIVVLGDPVLTLLHAPEDEANTTEEESTSNTTHYTANDALLVRAEATAAAILTLWRRCSDDLASDGNVGLAGLSLDGLLAICIGGGDNSCNSRSRGRDGIASYRLSSR